MRKLLFVLIILPCLAMFADGVEKVLLVIKNTGEKVAVLINDVDSIIVEDADIVDDRFFLLDKDTVFITDTLIEHDSITLHDTVTVHDTITTIQTDTLTLTDTLIQVDTLVRVDTVIQVDTLIERDTITRVDTVIQLDTLTINDTLEVHDTTYVYETVNNSINAADKWYYNLENPSVSDYLNNFEYDDDDYTYSKIEDYLVETPYSKERPLGVRLEWEGDADELLVAENPKMENAVRYSFDTGSNSFCLYNLIPGRKYYWQARSGGSIVKDSHFWTTGRMRMINVKGAHNVRDIGGIPTEDGRAIAYGRVFRGSEISKITDNDRSIFKDTLGIRAEVDVRTPNDITTSPDLGEDVAYSAFQGRYVNYIWISEHNSQYRQDYYNTIHRMLEYLREGKPIYIHCGGGADRTGAIILLLEGIAGCSETEIAKDYEITSFSIYGTRKRIDGVVYDGMTYEYARSIAYLKKFGKSTFQENVAAYLKKTGFTEEEIAELRNLLLE